MQESERRRGNKGKARREKKEEDVQVKLHRVLLLYIHRMSDPAEIVPWVPLKPLPMKTLAPFLYYPDYDYSGNWESRDLRER